MRQIAVERSDVEVEGLTRPKADIRSNLESSLKLPVGNALNGPASEAERTFPLVL